MDSFYKLPVPSTLANRKNSASTQTCNGMQWPSANIWDANLQNDVQVDKSWKVFWKKYN